MGGTESKSPSGLIVLGDLLPSKRWTWWPPAAPTQSFYEPMTPRNSFTNRINTAYFLQISVLQLLMLRCSVNSLLCAKWLSFSTCFPPAPYWASQVDSTCFDPSGATCAPPLTRWQLPLGRQKMQDYNLLCKGGILLTLLAICFPPHPPLRKLSSVFVLATQKYMWKVG